MNKLITGGYQFRFELKQLRSFLAVAEKLSFRAAAQELFISQPALSKHIAQLEAVLGCRLFVRDKSGVTLTEAGTRLYQTLPSLLEQLKQVTTRLDNAEQSQPKLKIGYTFSTMASFFPRLIRELGRTLPEYEYEFIEGTNNSLIDDVKNHRINGAFVTSRPKGDLAKFDIRTEPMGLMLPDNHHLTSHQAVPVNSLINETLILFPRQMNEALYDQIIAYCERAGFYPNRIIEAQSGHATVAFVASGTGIAFVVSSMSDSCLKGVVYRDLERPCPQVEFSFISNLQAGETWLNEFESQMAAYFSSENQAENPGKSERRYPVAEITL